jgi:hypothetical protein
MNLSEKVAELQADVARARREHFRLVWVVGGGSWERTTLLRAFAEADDGEFVEVGKKLSGSLLEVPAPLRTASVEECFAAGLAESPDDVTCLDRLEILFEPSLRINPVSLIKGTSRHSVIVAAWPGTVGQGCLVFGPAEHPSHFRIADQELESIVHHI